MCIVGRGGRSAGVAERVVKAERKEEARLWRWCFVSGMMGMSLFSFVSFSFLNGFLDLISQRPVFRSRARGVVVTIYSSLGHRSLQSPLIPGEQVSTHC